MDRATFWMVVADLSSGICSGQRDVENLRMILDLCRRQLEIADAKARSFKPIFEQARIDRQRRAREQYA